MEDADQYPVFFECPSLSGEQIKKIENYFHIRRKSGGGDCGSVTQINDKVYSIAFKYRDAQQRVLLKSEHVLEFAGGPLVLTVRGSVGPASKSAGTKLNLTSSQQSPQSIPASSPPPSGEEYELKIDSYLLRYLKECPKAEKELEKELASVACSAQFNPEKGTVSVRSLAQPGSVDEVQDWEAEVKTLFDGYLCHYELDPHKIKALLQSCSSRQTTDEVKVYSEVGMAVVVGTHSQVNAKLMEVKDSRVKQGSRLSEKQTSIRRLGEAKLRLLWKEIEHGLRRDFPGVKVTQGDAGQLFLEGSVGEILKAGDWISNEEKLVSEKKVSDMSPHFLTFLKTAYGGPGVLGDFLQVGDQVEIELRDTEIRFFTLSAHKLDKTVKILNEKFKEVKIDVPNCSTVPSELLGKLKSKTNELNQVQYKAHVFGTDSSVYLLGHAKEVDELSETVTQFILDHLNIEGHVVLPFPELVKRLPDLLKLYGFDHSGVTLRPLTSSSRPVVVLEGLSSKVTEVRDRLRLFLDSLVQDSVTIDLPGAIRYFQGPSGRENILSVAKSQKCLIQPQEHPHATRQNFASSAGLIDGNTTVASYSLRNGLQVLVCQGDITELDADALVNAANEDLDHCGGVAAALSKAGGPQVQKESKAIVKQTGKIATGEVVVTTGGNLKCKKLLHAVGPVAGGGRDRVLVEKTAQSALDLAEMMEFRSIAMPCISSGIFGVPVSVCSEAIVTAVKKFASQEGRSLRRIILIDNRREVVRAMQEACDRLLQGITTGEIRSDLEFQMGAAAQDTARGATAEASGAVNIEIIQGTIETQQVDGLVSPMVGHNLLSTRIGDTLSRVVGPQLTTKFNMEAGGATLPGDTVVVVGLHALQCKGVFFLNLIPWDNNQQGGAVQALRSGIRKILACCRIRGFSSVAFPVLGTGAVLRFPHNVASRVLLEEVRTFEQNQTSRTSFLIRIIIHPSDKESSKALQSVQETLHLRGFTNDANANQASFYRHVSGTNDEVTAMLGDVKLQMVRGDIIHENTDAIINTTDFSKNPSGVSKAILLAAGAAVQAQLAQVGTPADSMCTTGPGLLGCREIVHASFMSDPETIRKKCKKILKQCETKGYRSAAFPAINTGQAGLDCAKACKAMLDGMTSAITDLKPKFLLLIRIVILQEHVFQTFRSELEKRFGLTATPHLKLRERAKQALKKFQDKLSRTSATSASQGKAISIKPLPAVLSVIGCNPDTITIKRDLERILQKQIIEREEEVCNISKLDDMELEAVQAKVKALDISLEYKRQQSSEGVHGNRTGHRGGAEARHPSGSAGDVYVLKGLKEDVLSVTELVNRAIQKALTEDLRDKEEAMMALKVQWSILDVSGEWQELSLHDNYALEEAHIKKGVHVDVMTADGMKVTVNLKAKEATNWSTGITYKVKRIETDTTLELPAHWEPMDGELFKKVELQPQSQEYQKVAQGFLKTAQYNIRKIERVQNFYTWNGFAVLRQRIIAKNGAGALGEKFLFHGTSAESCYCIERDRFDRNYAGTHAALFGKGVYFAVNAAYSARGYSPPDAAGLRRMYVARVLTGRYTVGNRELKAAPPRGFDPTDCYDSVVDNQQQPSMFVIFHDDQAYPEYLITFS